MHETSFSKMRAFVARYLSDNIQSELTVLDVGARSVLGHQTYRDLFNDPAWRFVGLDIETGANVDIVVDDPYDWRAVESERFEVAISGQALEHVDFPWRVFREVFRVLRGGGLFCLIVPSSGSEHRYPVDCWRFYPDSMRALAADSGFRLVEVFTDFGLGEWQDTFAVFQKPARRRKPAAFPPQTDRGVAFSEYAKALTTRPRSPVYYRTLARLFDERGEAASAELSHRIGAEVFPINGEIRRGVVAALLRRGEVVAAAEHAVTLLGLKPLTAENVAAAGEVIERLAPDQRAHYGRLLPAELHVLKRIGTLAAEAEWYRLAASAWERAAMADGADAALPVNRLLALFGAGERQAALAGFRALRDAGEAAGQVTRTSVIQRFISLRGASRYLEIGVERGVNFFQIEAADKLAVDPEFKIAGGAVDFPEHRFFASTSDAFFAAPPADVVERGIDVALIDGLHTHEQALRDVDNCLRFLNPGGLIVMHDCLPASPAEAAHSLEAARAMPGFKGEWTGDVYKAVARLRATRADLFVAVLDTDHGVGLVSRGEPDSVLQAELAEIDALGFAKLKAAPGKWLNLKPATWFADWVAQAAAA